MDDLRQHFLRHLSDGAVDHLLGDLCGGTQSLQGLLHYCPNHQKLTH